MFRYPESVTDEDATATRDYFVAQEAAFNKVHQELRPTLKLHAKEAGGMQRWSSPVAFIDDFWADPKNLGRYIEVLWGHWKLSGSAPVEALLKHEAWRLFFDGWGASIYARSVQHPQRRKVQSSDLVQLIYLGAMQDRVLATCDQEFRDLGNAILRGRYHLAEIVPLDVLIA